MEAGADGDKVVFLLGGQGTQYFGMARPLFDGDETFSSTMHDLDKLAVRRYERSVLDYLYDPKRGLGDRCDDLRLTFLGLFMVEYSLARSLDVRGIRPDILVGSSLGEFIAVSVAGVVPVDECVAFLCDVADHVVATMPPGGMIAVLSELDRFREMVKPSADLALASVNSDKHFVISGDTVALERARRQMDEHRMLYQELPVNFAFHSPAADPLLAGMRAAGANMRWDLSGGTAEIYSSMAAGPLTEVSAESCWRVIREPIRFTEAVANIPAYRRHRYVDLSPSSTLASILRLSMPETTAFPVITPFNAEFQNIERLTHDVLPNPRGR